MYILCQIVYTSPTVSIAICSYGKWLCSGTLWGIPVQFMTDFTSVRSESPHICLAKYLAKHLARYLARYLAWVYSVEVYSVGEPVLLFLWRWCNVCLEAGYSHVPYHTDIKANLHHCQPTYPEAGFSLSLFLYASPMHFPLHPTTELTLILTLI